MPHETFEHSIQDGRPVWLFEFGLGSQRWRYATGDRNRTWQGNIWQHRQISFDRMRESDTPRSDTLTVAAPADLPLVRLFQAIPPTEEISLDIRSLHVDDGTETARLQWGGSIVDVKHGKPGQCEIACQSIEASTERAGLRICYERGCPYALFDLFCGVNREDYRVPATIIGITGDSIEAAAVGEFGATWFTGGFIEWPANGIIQRRFVEAHSGTSLRLQAGTHGLAEGMAIDAFPGCARTAEVCADKFDNILSYGGFWMLPGKSPFDGHPVF